ncbi:hypothetical protein ILYODFUR_024667 [Ilyodon furcidens]|uniref:Uncharacterized protein n=1 Tax=Ilyodon furcidens TaxID=33524 RepID=A0ABV0UXK7_9TELE
MYFSHYHRELQQSQEKSAFIRWQSYGLRTSTRVYFCRMPEHGQKVSCSQEIDHSRLCLVRSAHPSLVSFPALILFTSG